MSVAALAYTDAEPERPTQPRVWVILPARAPYPLNPPAFSPDRLNKPEWHLKPEDQAEGTAQRNSRILAARIPPTRRWQLSTKPEARCETTKRLYGEQLALIRDTTPAASLGVTILQAAVDYRRPYREVFAAYVNGQGERDAPIGQRDHWDCWYASHSDLEATFGQAAAQRRAQATEANWQTRAAQRLARNQIRTYREGGK